MFDDTRTAILPRSGSDRWSALMLALGFHGAVGVTLLLATLLVVRPVEIFVPTDSIVVTIPIDIPASGGSPPPSAPASAPPRASSGAAPLLVPDPLSPPLPLDEAPVPNPEPWEGADLGLDLGPGVGHPGFGSGPGGGGGTGTGIGPGPGDGTGDGWGGHGPVELSGEIEPPRLVVKVEPTPTETTESLFRDPPRGTVACNLDLTRADPRNPVPGVRLPALLRHHPGSRSPGLSKNIEANQARLRKPEF